MGAIGIIGDFSKLRDVSFARTDLSPPQQGDAPSWETSASKLFMGPGGGGAFSLGVSDLGTTAGDTGVTGTRLVLAGIGRITLSQSTDAAGGTITISGGTAGAGAFSAGVSDIGNSLGDTGVTGTRMVLSGGGVITLSQQTDVDGATVGFSAPPQSVQTQNRFNLTLAGNTAGALQEVSSGTLTLVGGPNVTVSQNGNAVTLSAPDPVTTTPQSVQSIGLYADGNTTGQSSSTTRDARSVTLHGDGAVSVGFSGGSIRISAPTQSVQPETQTFVGGISASDALYTSGTVRITGVGGGVTVSSNTGQRIDISVAAPVAQTGTQFSAGISGGNTSGQTGTVAGRLVLAGGNRVTLSGSTNGASATITISGPNAQTGISSIAASDATYTSGQVQFTGSGIVTIRSSAGQRVVVDASQSVQTQDRFDLTISGNTSGAGALVSSGTLTLAGGNNITLSQAGNAITISGANVGGAQTGISGISASDTLYSSGTVEIVGSGDITVASAGGQRVVISGSQSVQTQGVFSAGISNLGNTAGDTGVTGTRLVLVGSDNITLSQTTGTAGATISIFGTSGGGGAEFSAGVSNVGNTVGNTGITGTRLVLAGGQSITLSQSTNASGGTVTISGASTSQSVQSVGMYALGNTTGESSSTTRDARSVSIRGDGIISLGYSNGSLRISASQSVQPETQTFLGGLAASDKNYTSGTVSLSGVGGGITVQSNAGQRIDLSVAAPVAQTDQTLGLYAVQNTTGQSSSTTRDARSISVAGDGAVSVGYSAGSLRISAPTQSVQPGIQNLVASDATFSSGTVSISGFGDVTVNTAANLIRISAPVQTAESQSFGMSNLGNTSGTTGIVSGAQVRFLLAGGNNITLSQSINGASGTITISAPNTAAQTNQTLGMYAVGNTTGQSSSTTMDARTLSVDGAGIVSAGYSAGSLRISATTSQSVQSIGMYAVQNTTGQSSSTTMDARTLSVAGDGAVSVGYSAGSLRISAPTQTVESQSIGMSNVGNTSGTTGMASGGQVRFVFAGGNNITLSQSLNGASGTITISAPNLGAGAMSAGVSNLGNSAGATGITGTQLVLVGSDNITLSQTTGANGGTVSIIGGGGGGFSAGVSTGGNTAGATGVTGTRLVLVGDSPISLSQTTGAAGATVSIDGPATSSLVGTNGVSISTNGSTISVQLPFRTQFYPFNDIPIVTGQQGQGTLHVAPLHFPNIQHDRLLLGLQISNATNSSNSITISAWAGIYSRNASSISLISSISTSTNFSGSGTVGSYSLYGGPKWLSIPWTNTITEDDYWFGILIRTTTGGGAGHTVSQLCVSKFTNSAWSGLLGEGSNATNQYQLGLGVYSASTSAMPGSIAFTQINGSGSMALREPIFHLRSGTV